MWPRWYNPPIYARAFLSDLLEQVADYYHVSVAEIKGEGRGSTLVCGRSVIARIMRERGCSYPRIARMLGRRDHTSIMHLCKTFDDRAQKYPEITTLYLRLRINEKRNERLAA